LKDISGNALSEDTAVVIGRADMKTNRYINSRICPKNTSREIQKSLIGKKEKERLNP